MIGAAYDFQILDQLPIGQHDVRMDCVITDMEAVINLTVGDSKAEAH